MAQQLPLFQPAAKKRAKALPRQSRTNLRQRVIAKKKAASPTQAAIPTKRQIDNLAKALAKGGFSMKPAQRAKMQYQADWFAKLQKIQKIAEGEAKREARALKAPSKKKGGGGPRKPSSPSKRTPTTRKATMSTSKKSQKKIQVRGHYAKNRPGTLRHWVAPHTRNPSWPQVAMGVGSAVGAGVLAYFVAEKFQKSMYEAKTDGDRSMIKWGTFAAGALASAFYPVVGAAVMAPVVAGYFAEKKALENVKPSGTPSTKGDVAGILLPGQGSYPISGVMLGGAYDGYLSGAGADAKIESIIAAL